MYKLCKINTRTSLPPSLPRGAPQQIQGARNSWNISNTYLVLRRLVFIVWVCSDDDFSDAENPLLNTHKIGVETAGKIHAFCTDFSSGCAKSSVGLRLVFGH